MKEVVARLQSEDLVAVATWLSTQNMPTDTAPASKVSYATESTLAMRQCSRAVQGTAMMFPQNFWRNVAWLWLSVTLLLVLAVRDGQPP
jgi:hypothetical protein